MKSSSNCSNPTYPQSQATPKPGLDGIASFQLTEEVIELAELLVQEKVMPQTLSGDAIHVAVATVNAMEYILSWNVRHLANPRKRENIFGKFFQKLVEYRQ